MQDRRKSNRIDAHNVGLRVYNSIDDEQLGIVGNLSAGGMMLITNRELFKDGILQLRVDPPTRDMPGPVQMGVKVLWCTPANSPSEFWAGLRTIDIGTNDGDNLQNLIAYLSNDD